MIEAARSIDSAEQAALLSLGLGIRSSYEREGSLVSCFAACVARVPDNVAVRAGAHTLTYAELDRRSNQVARRIMSFDLGPEAKIGVSLERSVLLPIALLGILKAGAAYVPLEAGSTSERLLYMQKDADLRAMIVADDDRQFGSLQRIDLERGAAAISKLDDAAFASGTSPRSLAYVMYTSGSTGRPKGVAIEHRAILRLVRATDFVDISERDVFLQLAPPAFDASTFEIWAPLLNGATLALAPPGPLSLEDIGNAVDRFGVSTLWLTAPLFRLMVETELPRFTGLKNLLTGGDTVSAEHAKRFLAAAPECRLIDGYGPTENTTFSCCYSIPSALDVGTSIPIGRPIANSCAHVLDENLQPARPGEIGELFVGGDGLARGYLNLPELTAERFIAHPFADDGSRLYRTGDRARMRADGVIEFFGRLDNQVKIRGYRIEIDEIERTLYAHASVLHAAVVVEERAGEKTLHAVLVSVPGACASVSDIRTLLAAELPAYMLPQRISFRDSLPQFSSGKIDRLALANDMREERAPIAIRRPVASTTLSDVVQIWQTTLDTNQVGIDENFFDAGGDSLLLLALQKRLHERFDIKVTVTDLFRESTIKKQADYIERLRS